MASSPHANSRWYVVWFTHTHLPTTSPAGHGHGGEAGQARETEVFVLSVDSWQWKASSDERFASKWKVPSERFLPSCSGPVLAAWCPHLWMCATFLLNAIIFWDKIKAPPTCDLTHIQFPGLSALSNLHLPTSWEPWFSGQSQPQLHLAVPCVCHLFAGHFLSTLIM